MQNKDGRSVQDVLDAAMREYLERESTYGGQWSRAGEVYAALFPSGVELKTAEDFQRYQMLSWCISKIGRYANAFAEGGHEDSARDLIMYATFLSYSTEEMEDPTLYGVSWADIDDETFDNIRKEMIKRGMLPPQVPTKKVVYRWAAEGLHNPIGFETSAPHRQGERLGVYATQVDVNALIREGQVYRGDEQEPEPVPWLYRWCEDGTHRDTNDKDEQHSKSEIAIGFDDIQLSDMLAKNLVYIGREVG